MVVPLNRSPGSDRVLPDDDGDQVPTATGVEEPLGGRRVTRAGPVGAVVGETAVGRAELADTGAVSGSIHHHGWCTP